MSWDIEVTDEFKAWHSGLSSDELVPVVARLALLREHGPALGYPYSSDIKGSRYGNMRELRIKHKGRQIRVLYAFNPRRTAILLFADDKTGDDRWYDWAVPWADKLYAAHLEELDREG